MAAGSMETREAYVAKVRAEVQALVDRGLVMAGQVLSPVLVLRGDTAALGDEAGPLTADEEAALGACLNRLGYEPGAWVTMLTCDGEAKPLSVDLLRTAIMALGPQTIIAADDGATRALRDVFAPELVLMADLDQALLAPGEVTNLLAMRVMALGGLTTSASPKADKALMWHRLQQLRPLDAPY